MMISELQLKDIIALETGERLGQITDLDIDVDNGNVKAIIITLKGKMMGLFGKEEEVVIPWEQIINIGADVILVKKPFAFPPPSTKENE
ncbi:YlmC/YmxH family sporulation protein [Thalassobacillus pellis]|uniref:YlmC/YmxH family sporulation protein n=1 Tax=Thalassobacillus pellis TaxID=748008 RepID=UPI0019618E32|nr:YlmC/YmxH family sporulation protein [Thalassobacillus pellis]MBM7552840.1 YlmC/YmxH family sporulation protein [Thalassobacillus pellis]